jgi:hypothetical protein
MRRQVAVFLLLCGVLATVVSAQSTNTFPSAGNAGVGTTTPLQRFTVMTVENGYTPVYGGYSSTTANAAVTLGKAPFMEFIGSGDGNNTPSLGLLQLDIQGAGTYLGPAAIYLAATRATTASAAGTQPVANGDILGRIGFYGDEGSSMRYIAGTIDSEIYTAITPVSTGVLPAALNLATHSNAPIVFYTNVGSGSAGQLVGSSGERMRVDYNGNVGIGTTSPGSKLEVNGNIKLTSGSGGTVTYADGTAQSTAWTGVLCGGDYAESVDVSGDLKHYGPGDVLVIASKANGDVEKSAEPYSTMVAGIYATKPGVIGRRQLTPKAPDEVPMAMVGIVPAKVVTENGPIHKGDLLVTASMPGYAMKGTDRERMLGAVIGKAMSSLESGTGVIEVLVTLQ